MRKEVTLLQHMAAGRGKIFCLTQRHFFMLVHTAFLWSVMIWVHWTVIITYNILVVLLIILVLIIKVIVLLFKLYGQSHF